MNRSRAFKNIIFSALSQVTAIVAGLFFSRLVLSWYGSATFGLLDSVNQVFAYFILLEAGIGLASLQALYLPVSRDDKKSISSIIAATRRYYDRMGLVYLAAVLVFAAVYSLWIGSVYAAEGVAAYKMAGVIIFTGLGNVVNFVYQGKYKILMQAEGKNYVVTNAQIMLTILGCLLKVIGIYSGFSIVWVMGLGFVASLVQTGFYYWYIKKNYQWLDVTAEPAKITQNRSVFLHQVSQLIFQNTDVIILTILCGLRVVSVYAVYKLVVSAVGTFTYQFSESLLFIFGQDYAKDKEQYCRDIDRFDQAYTMLSFCMFSAACLLYLPFVELYTNNVTDINYIDRWLPLMFIGIELLSGLRRAMQNTITVSGHFKQTVPRSIAEAVINLGLTLALVPKIGIYGALIGTIAALLYRSNDIIIYGNRRILGRSPLPAYRLYAVNLLAFVPVALVSLANWLHFSNYLHFLLWGIIATVCCAVWYLGINLICFRRRVKEVLALLKRR